MYVVQFDSTCWYSSLQIFNAASIQDVQMALLIEWVDLSIE